MGVTISYRGSLAELDRIVDFEDRAIDLALELGGQARVWRTTGDDDPSRVVRGVLLNLFPGQETFSLLISPEGWLIGLRKDIGMLPRSLCRTIAGSSPFRALLNGRFVGVK